MQQKQWAGWDKVVNVVCTKPAKSFYYNHCRGTSPTLASPLN